jgi:hypothetical protein
VGRGGGGSGIIYLHGQQTELGREWQLPSLRSLAVAKERADVESANSEILVDY